MDLAALILRTLGFLLYGGPMVAFTVLIALSARGGHSAPEVVRTYRAWGPGFGLGLGAAVLGMLTGYYLEHSAFSWGGPTLADQLTLAAWLTFLVLWASNIKLEIWTLEPLRKLDKGGQISDMPAYMNATRRLSRHMVVQSALILAWVVLDAAAGSSG